MKDKGNSDAMSKAIGLSLMNKTTSYSLVPPGFDGGVKEEAEIQAMSWKQKLAYTKQSREFGVEAALEEKRLA